MAHQRIGSTSDDASNQSNDAPNSVTSSNGVSASSSRTAPPSPFSSIAAQNKTTITSSSSPRAASAGALPPSSSSSFSVLQLSFLSIWVFLFLSLHLSSLQLTQQPPSDNRYYTPWEFRPPVHPHRSQSDLSKTMRKSLDDMADNSAYVYDLSVENDADDDVDDEFMKLTEEVLSGEAMNGSYSNSIDSNDGDVRGSNDGADEDTNYSNTDDSNNGGLDDDDDDSINNGRSDETVNEDVTMEVEELEGNDKVEEGMIAWLMSFPNSGTSFTSLLVRHASNATTATNYGMESNPGVDGKSVPVYDWSEKGPYWLHPPPGISNSGDGVAGSHIDENSNDGDTEESSTPFHSGTELGKSGKYVIPPKSSYIFTKTHCGSRCAFCPPKKYLETWRSFLKMCLTGSRSVPYASDSANEQKINPKLIHGKNLKLPTIYHPSIVKKAVHLIRNPFDNLVSRFHHELKEHAKKKDARWMSRYENSISGFRTWCADQDATFYKDELKEDWEEWGYDDDIMRYFEGVPCHADFFRYAQWHSLANRVVQKMDIPILYIYYDEYLTNLEGSTKDILEFLNLPHIGDLPTFDSNKDYSGYFTQEERAVASELMRRVANEDGRRLLERYWVSLDFEKLRKETKELN